MSSDVINLADRRAPEYDTCPDCGNVWWNLETGTRSGAVILIDDKIVGTAGTYVCRECGRPKSEP